MNSGLSCSGSGVIRVSLPNGGCEDLVSSRRVPPQNTLDGRPLGEPIDLWTSAAGLRLSFYNQPIYTMPAGKSDWTPLTDVPPVKRGKVTPAANGQKEDLRIPLSFDYGQVNDPALNRARPLSISFTALNATDAGVLLPEFTHRGFWLLPWADIDAYRAKLNPTTATLASPKPAE